MRRHGTVARLEWPLALPFGLSPCIQILYYRNEFKNEAHSFSYEGGWKYQTKGESQTYRHAMLPTQPVRIEEHYLSPKFRVFVLLGGC